jgi:hypothetical protein
MIASYWPSSSLRRRVSRLPRRLVTASIGYWAWIWDSRRRLEVPTTAPGGMSSRLVLVGDEGVEGHFALGDGDQRELGREGHRHVLHRMHGDVGGAVEERGFELLDEQALAAHLGQRPVEDLVAAGGHAQQLDGAGRVEGFEAGLDVLGLPQGEAAFTGGDDDAVGRRGAHGRGSAGLKEILGMDRHGAFAARCSLRSAASG